MNDDSPDYDDLYSEVIQTREALLLADNCLRLLGISFLSIHIPKSSQKYFEYMESHPDIQP